MLSIGGFLFSNTGERARERAERAHNMHVLRESRKNYTQIKSMQAQFENEGESAGATHTHTI